MASIDFFSGGPGCSSIVSSAGGTFGRIPGSVPGRKPVGGRFAGKLESSWPSISGPNVIPAISAAGIPTSSNGGPPEKALPGRHQPFPIPSPIKRNSPRSASLRRDPLSKKPSPHVSIRLLTSGAEEAGFFGIKDYLKHHQELAKPETLFINLDSVGGGELHWAIGEGHLEHIPYPQPGLEALSDVERRSGMAVLPRIPIMAPTDAGPVAKKGNMVLTLIGLDNKSIPPNFHKTFDTFDRLDLANLKRAADIVELLIRNSG